MTDDDDIWDSLFHGAAWRAYLEIYAETKQFPPDSETTRRLAYQYYEEALAEKNRSKQPADISRSPRRAADPGLRSAGGGRRPSRR